jgi:hypothetical protein
MKNVIAIQTTIQTVFGEVDENGDVTRKVPAQVDVLLTEEQFLDALRQLKEAKAKLSEEPPNP